jgi:hypothetical protein
MADNSLIATAGGNETFANDDVGGVKYSRHKVNWGADGATNDADTAFGKGLPVQVCDGFSLIDVTLSLDTSPYASGDLLADTQVVTSAIRLINGRARLQSVLIIDEDDQGVAFDLYFLSANNTMGTENSAPSISDANARDILCRVPIATGDYYDLGGVRIADVHGLNRIIKAASGTTSIYVAAVNGSGTPTYTASGLKLRIGIEQG